MINTTLPFSRDAAMVLGVASSAMPFAQSPDDEAERWLRVLRLHGEVGAALQRLGVGEAPLKEPTVRAGDLGEPPPEVQDSVRRVVETAELSAGERGVAAVGTLDLLVGVLEVYGATFDRTLDVRGTSRDELLESLAAA